MKTIMLFLYSEIDYANGAAADLFDTYSAHDFDINHAIFRIMTDENVRENGAWISEFLDVLVIDHARPGVIDKTYRFEIEQLDEAPTDAPEPGTYVHDWKAGDSRRWTVVRAL